MQIIQEALYKQIYLQNMYYVSTTDPGPIKKYRDDGHNATKSSV